MDPRPVLASAALDEPRASIDREVRACLGAVAAAHAQLRDAIADATGVLPDPHSQLAGAAAAQVRLTQRFLDAQRAVLALWADTDAKVARVVETAALEAAVLGVDIGGRVVVGGSPAPDPEPQLQALLEAWWVETHRAGDRAIADAHAQASQWLEVAQLAAGTDDIVDAPTGEGPDDADGPVVEVTRAEPHGTIERAGAAELLPEAVHDALAEASHHRLEQLLASLLDALDDPADLELPGLVGTTGDGAPGPDRDQTPDGFDLFWGNGRASASPRRSVVLDAIMPMAVVSLLLVVVLAWIG